MERLTIHGFNFNSDFVASHLQSWPIAQALGRLQMIEDILGDEYDLTRLRALVQARDEGRVVELPKQAIAARYDVADMLSDFKKEAEFDDPSVGIHGITWAESDLLQAIIDGLNVGCAEAEAAFGGGGDG